MSRDPAREQGAIAIVVVFLSIALFGITALAVDLSNTVVRKRDVQRQADFAALAGGAELPSVATGTVPAVVVDAVRDQLNGGASKINLPQDDDVDGRTPVQSGDLVDGNPINGEVEFANGGLRVTAPQLQVNYTFARVFNVLDSTKNFDNTQVSADATTWIFSPGLGVMPSYAWKGCDWGPQYILDDSTTIEAELPELASPDDTNDAKVESLSFSEATSVLEITGKKLGSVTEVGFFPEGSGAPVTVPPSGPPTSTTINVGVPSAVTGAEQVWWVRVLKGGVWSPVEHGSIQRFTTGDTASECDSHSSDGNYGTLDIPRPSGDVTGNDIVAKNMATSLEVSLSILPGGDAKCDGRPAPYIHVPNDGTNCVPVKTGFPHPGTTQGLIDGIGGIPGRLDVANGATNSACGSNTLIRGKTLNNDHLTCFFTNDSVKIRDIAKGSYSGGPVLSPEIFDSPRFMWLPVVKVEPDTGQGEYTLLDIRPAFLTDQDADATRTNKAFGDKTDNGLLMGSSGIRAVKVVIFDLDALPPADDGTKVTPYVGVGQKIVRLID